MCGGEGVPLYYGLKDLLFGVPGEWSYRECKNPECELVWPDPMPIEEDISRAYVNYYTHKDKKLSPSQHAILGRLSELIKNGYLSRKYGYLHECTPFWQKMLGLLLYFRPLVRVEQDFKVFYLPRVPDGRLLEVGCGGGGLLKIMQELGWKTEGVDFDPAAVENALGKGLRVHLGGLKEVNFSDNHFDAIAMIHLIEHVHDPVDLLQECRRILKPGGSVLIVTPNVSSLGHRVFGSAWRGLEPPRHLHLFSKSSLNALAKKAGLDPCWIRSSFRDADNLFLASIRLAEKQKGKEIDVNEFAWRGAKRMQRKEILAKVFGRDCGEELVLLARKI